jgi:hypothetical protein
MSAVLHRSAVVLALAGAMSMVSAQPLRSDANVDRGIPSGGSFVPAGTLYDNEQSNGSTSLASQDSSGTVTARSADDFVIDGANCPSNQFDITQIRIQMVQADAAPQPFAVDLYADDGTGAGPSPTNAIAPIATVAEAGQTSLGAFGTGTSIFEASFTPVGLVLDGGTRYWISGYGATAASNAGGFNNFFAASNGSGATTDNGVIIAPGAGVANWTPADTVIGPPALAFAFAIDGTCRAPDVPQVPVPFSPGSWLFLLGVIGLLGGIYAARRGH